MGDPEFNSNYIDVPAELKTLHAENVHAMISIWPQFHPNSRNFAALSTGRLDIPETQDYDATNPKARDFYWNNLASKLFKQGWDAFWLDSSEPEEYWPHNADAILRDKQLAIGSGAAYTNVFPLMHTTGVQQHWKAVNDTKRVFILTRSAFLGQQRVGAAVWSGDISSTYWALGRQVPAGLNLALSGYPYWTTDIGGYWPATDPFSPTDPEYQKLYARWFEFGAFCPIFRTHGHRSSNEMWTYNQVEPILLEYDKLRYRLMPYIYSLAWRVHDEDYTIQRPLVMDWRSDPETWNIGDQFMFGPALLVSPILKKNATERDLYLPNALWYNFWTGDLVHGGRHIETPAPLERIPLYVRAGSILPLGPEVEYADQKPDDPIELRVYPGADGAFTLYEDEGDNYRYEKGSYAEIPIRWSDAEKKLTIEARTGEYPGMPRQRTFQIVCVGSHHGTGETVEAHPDQIVRYTGKAITVSMR